MRKFLSGVVISAMALSGLAAVGVGSAGAATATTLVLSGKAPALDGPPTVIKATASVPGTVTFTLNGTAISACTSVATTSSTATPPVITATCPIAATAPGTLTIGATLTPTDTSYATATATALVLTVATPVQGQTGPGSFSYYVDTVLGSNANPAGAYPLGTCSIINEFVIGQSVIFRVFANSYDLGGAPLTSKNVSSASITVAGYSTPVVLSYGAHGTTSFWSGALRTGTAAGQYSTLGVINYTITFNTIAVPAVTKKVTATKWVLLRKHGKVVYVNRHAVYVPVKYQKTVVVTPAVPGATATFSPFLFPSSSQLTLNAAK